MKIKYVSPSIKMEEVKIEKGFATSDSFSIQQFQYDSWDGVGEEPQNSAW